MPGRLNDSTMERWKVGAFPRSRVPSFIRSTVPAFSSFLRQLAGMPDYAAHLKHLSRCHPAGPVPTERQFYEDFVRTRYGDGPTRCC
jgi:uncharacterized short protein YbdD (DUF466 family)